MKKIAILGSTGSIGRQTLEVIKQHPKEFQVTGISGKDEVEELEKQILEFKPKIVSVENQEVAKQLEKTAKDCELVFGEKGLLDVATMQEADTVVGALVGFLGLKPTLKAIEAGKNIALANKETLVAAGHLVMQAVKQNNVMLTPIDSEHSALFQCIKGEDLEKVKRLIITCSGGPFKFKKKKDLKNVTAKQALGHPTWNMGAKITVDSATLFNKGLEVIEAHWLYNMPFEKIQTMMHPQSIVHSMIEFVDGSIMAQVGTHDMRVPIQYALSHPERIPNTFPKLDFVKEKKLEFFEIDEETFKGLPLAVKAGKISGTMPAVMNASNEEAVFTFLEEKAGFLQIAETVEQVMEKHNALENPTLEQVLEADDWARKETRKILGAE